MLKTLTITIFIFLTACSTTSREKQGPSTISHDISDQPQGKTIGSQFKNMSGKTQRFISRQQLFQVGCKHQSDKHNEQRVITALAPPVVLVPNTITGSLEAVQLPSEYQTKVYNQAVAPFDMISCLAQAGETGWERIGGKFIKTVFGDLANTVVKYGAGYLVADKALDFLTERDRSQAELVGTLAENSAPSIEGDNNRVVIGDSNTYNEAGGIPVEPLTFAEAELANSGDELVESEEPDFVCVEVRRTLPIDPEGVDANGNGFACSNGAGLTQDDA